MKRSEYLCVLLFLLAALPAFSAGPVDGEVAAVWWASDYEVTGDSPASADAGAPGLKAELWLRNRYGLRATQFNPEPDGFAADDASYTSVDVMWKALSPTENNFLAVGLGYQDFELAGIDSSGVGTSGMRATVQGRVSLVGLLTGYAEASYLPSLDDQAGATVAAGRFEDMEGMEYELGVAWKMMPFVSLKGGYRESSVDYRQTGIVGGPATEANGTVESNGIFAGVAIGF